MRYKIEETSFDSILVRLKVKRYEVKDGVFFRSFDSILVRLKAYTFITTHASLIP